MFTGSLSECLVNVPWVFEGQRHEAVWVLARSTSHAAHSFVTECTDAVTTRLFWVVVTMMS